MTSLDGIKGRSIQTLLRGENDSKKSDEIQAIGRPAAKIFGRKTHWEQKSHYLDISATFKGKVSVFIIVFKFVIAPTGISPRRRNPEKAQNKHRTSRRDLLGRFCDIYCAVILRYVLSVTFCGAVVMKVMDQKTLVKRR